MTYPYKSEFTVMFCIFESTLIHSMQLNWRSEAGFNESSLSLEIEVLLLDSKPAFFICNLSISTLMSNESILVGPFSFWLTDSMSSQTFSQTPQPKDSCRIFLLSLYSLCSFKKLQSCQKVIFSVKRIIIYITSTICNLKEICYVPK